MTSKHDESSSDSSSEESSDASSSVSSSHQNEINDFTAEPVKKRQKVDPAISTTVLSAADPELASCTLSLDGLPTTVTEIDVKNLFKDAARPESIEIRPQSKQQQKFGADLLKRAFVKFACKKDTNTAYQLYKAADYTVTLPTGDVQLSVAARDSKTNFPSNRLMVCALPYQKTNQKKLFNFCNPKPVTIQLFKHRFNQQIPTNATFTFADKNDAQLAKTLFETKNYKNTAVWVKFIQGEPVQDEDDDLKQAVSAELSGKTRLVVLSNVSWKVNSNDIWELFREFGQIICIKVFRTQDGVNKGTAEVLFETCEQATDVVDKCQQSKLKGLPVKIVLASEEPYVPMLQSVALAIDRPRMVYKIEQKLKVKPKPAAASSENPYASANANGAVTCYGCGETGHMSRECPQKSARFAGVECYSCGKTGHMSRECPDSKRSYGECYNCGESGHISRDCPEKAKGIECYNCGESGHMSRECPQGGSRGRNCYNCGEAGHISRECPQNGGDSGFGRRGRGRGGRGRARGRGGFRGRGRGGRSRSRGRGGRGRGRRY